MTGLTIISDIPQEHGWAPILHMQRLLADLTGAAVHDVSTTSFNRLESLIYGNLPRQRVRKDQTVIFIAPRPASARKFVPCARALGGFARAAIWIIDSFRTEDAEREHRLLRRQFDFIAYSQGFDDAVYRGLFGDRAIRLEWGSDALGLGSAQAERDVDLLRIGRQPADWDEDEQSKRAFEARGLRFAGRPAMGPLDDDSMRILMQEHYSRAKYVLAFSNVAAPASYTHPTKAYLTGRWTDALASGAAVAGIPPEGDLHLIDWPEALLRLSSMEREQGLQQIEAAVAGWTQETARANHLGALRRLDWRWRFRKLTDVLGVEAPLLDQEIERLNARIEALAAMGKAPA